MSYLDWCKLVKSTNDNFLIYVKSLQYVDCSQMFCDVVMGKVIESLAERGGFYHLFEERVV